MSGIVSSSTPPPPTLPKIGTSAIWHSSSTQYGGPFTYRYNAANSTTDYAVYGLHYDDTDETYAGSGFTIKVGITSGSDYNTWLDASSGGPPTEVIENSDGTVSLNDSSGNLLYKFTNPYYEAPAYRTGTSQSFAFTSGDWKNNGYSAVLDDEANSSSGKLVNSVRQFEWDMPDIGGGRLYSGANNWIYFVPGTAEDNGTWYHSSTSTGGTAGNRNGRVISIGTSATFDETDAFVDGLVPYGDIP